MENDSINEYEGLELESNHESEMKLDGTHEEDLPETAGEAGAAKAKAAKTAA